MLNRYAAPEFRAHRVEHGKPVLAADVNMLSIDVETVADKVGYVRSDLVDHQVDHVQTYETASLRRRLDAVEEKQWAAPTAAEVERATVGGLVAGGLVVLAGVLIIRAIGAASSEATK